MRYFIVTCGAVVPPNVFDCHSKTRTVLRAPGLVKLQSPFRRTAIAALQDRVGLRRNAETELHEPRFFIRDW